MVQPGAVVGSGALLHAQSAQARSALLFGSSTGEAASMSGSFSSSPSTYQEPAGGQQLQRDEGWPCRNWRPAGFAHGQRLHCVRSHVLCTDKGLPTRWQPALGRRPPGKRTAAQLHALHAVQDECTPCRAWRRTWAGDLLHLWPWRENEVEAVEKRVGDRLHKVGWEGGWRDQALSLAGLLPPPTEWPSRPTTAWL